MRLAVALLSVVAVVLADTQLNAQERPSFAGTWTMIADPAAGGDTGGRGGRGRGGRGGLGQTFTIAQEAAALTLTRSGRGGEIRMVYNLDGSESRNSVAGRGGTTTEQVSRARWDGQKLVITTTRTMGENTVETTMALSLDTEGNLVVESTSPGRGGGAATTQTQRYRKG